MDLNKIFNFLASSNIDRTKIVSLVKDAQNLDLEDDEDLRDLIIKAASLINKEIDDDKIDSLISKIKENKIHEDLKQLFF